MKSDRKPPEKKTGNPPLDKHSKAALRQLSKLCDKTEKLCVPIQRVLVEIANLPPHREIVHRVDFFQSRLAIVNAALHQLEEKSFQRGGEGLNRLASRAMTKLESMQGSRPEIEGKAPVSALATLSGKCPEFPIASVMLFLVKQRKTGTLKFQLDHETLMFEVFDGDIVYSSTENPVRGERLGEILIENGHVKMEHFMAFIDGFRSDGELLGMALVEQEIVSMEALSSALVEQMQQRFDRVFSAEDCRFEFFESSVSSKTGLHINFSEFLVESGRVSAEAAAAAKSDIKSEWGQASKVSGKWKGAPTGGWGSPETK